MGHHFFQLVLSLLLLRIGLDHIPLAYTQEPEELPEYVECSVCSDDIGGGCESEFIGYYPPDPPPICPDPDCVEGYPPYPPDGNCEECIQCQKEYNSPWFAGECVAGTTSADCDYPTEQHCLDETVPGGECGAHDCQICVGPDMFADPSVDDGRRDKGDYTCETPAPSDPDECLAIDQLEHATYCGEVDLNDCNSDPDPDCEPDMTVKCYASTDTPFGCGVSCDCEEVGDGCGYEENLDPVTGEILELAFRQCCDESTGEAGYPCPLNVAIPIPPPPEPPPNPADDGAKLRCLISDPPLGVPAREYHLRTVKRGLPGTGENGTCGTPCQWKARFWATHFNCDFPGIEGIGTKDACCLGDTGAEKWYLDECTCSRNDPGGGDDGSDTSIGISFGSQQSQGGQQSDNSLSIIITPVPQQANLLAKPETEDPEWENTSLACDCDIGCGPRDSIDDRCFVYACSYDNFCHRKLRDGAPKSFCYSQTTHASRASIPHYPSTLDKSSSFSFINSIINIFASFFDSLSTFFLGK